MAPGVAFALSLIFVVGHLQDGPGSLAKSFTFPEYPYKETTKNVSRPCSSVEFYPRRGEWCARTRRLWTTALRARMATLLTTLCTPANVGLVLFPADI